MTRPTVLLLGGKHKGEPYTELGPELARTGRAVIAYGEAAPLIEQDLGGVVPLTRLGSSFDEVIATARELARDGRRRAALARLLELRHVRQLRTAGSRVQAARARRATRDIENGCRRAEGDRHARRRGGRRRPRALAHGTRGARR